MCVPACVNGVDNVMLGLSELLHGARYGGVFQYNQRVQTTVKTADGWV